jgi:hypothetical protein
MILPFPRIREHPARRANELSLPCGDAVKALQSLDFSELNGI